MSLKKGDDYSGVQASELFSDTDRDVTAMVVPMDSRSSDYLLKVIDCVADPIFVKDRRHAWVLLNDAFCHFMGRRREDLLGKSDYDFFPSHEADVFWKKDEEVFRTGLENVNEEFFTDGQGVCRTIVTKKTLYRGPADAVFIVGVIRDISALRQTTQELQAAYERLQNLQGRLVQSEKMASLGQLAAGIAHEINNPVAYMLLNLHTLREYQEKVESFMKTLDPGTMASAEGGRLMEILTDCPVLMRETVEGGEKIKKIVNDLKIFAHPAEGTFEYGDLHACIDRAMDILTGELKYKVKLVKDYGKLPPVRFKDPQMLQVFVNLLSNAAQAIETTGTITVRTRSQGRHVIVQVKDTGRGISPEDIMKVFDPFFTTKPVGQGTGLGLSVVHGIITKHQGMISVVSQAGDGTEFTVKLLRDGPDVMPAEA